MAQEPPPPPPEPFESPAPIVPQNEPESSSEIGGADESGESAGRFRTLVAIAIAAVSILGAIVAVTGTLAEQTARQLDQQGLQDEATQQEIVTDLNSTVQEDVRNLAPYQEDVKAAEVLQSQAADEQSSDPSVAAQLNAEAQSYLVEARTRLSFFQGATPQPGASASPSASLNPVQYNQAQALQRLENNNTQLSELKPDATLDQAETQHGKSVNLVGLVTLFIASLLFLTLAQFARPATRRFFAGAGGLVAAAALVLWIVVLVTGG
ncbi:MAG: hypothetical protein JOY80_02550 [Candidatus Dormibacteraeota bacterium]|nr:hypothetical protein [Candidatus Dormibacteraeota bacterium]